MTPLLTLALAAFGGAILLAACAPPAPVDSPTVPIHVPDVAVTAAPAASVTAAPAPPPPPPTGPGTIACGATRCRAGAEICCLGASPRCVAAPAVRAGAGGYEEADARQKACGTDVILACDDAGDCGAGQTCCDESYSSETKTISLGACRPLRAGRVVCEREELCSLEDRSCARRDTVCADARGGGMRCRIPPEKRTRPRCGKKPCAAGETCVLESGAETCTAERIEDDWFSRAAVVECNRGRDCGEDQACYQNPQLPGRRCDYALAGIDGLSEPAYCTGAEDCAGYCRHDARSVPSCHVAGKGRSGRCECLDPCTKDADCPTCDRLAILRDDLGSGGRPFCDRRKGACDCRPKRP